MTVDAGKSQIAYARLAGAMFLLVDALYAIGLAITGRFRVPGDVLETGRRILQSEALYRAGLSSSLLGALCTVLIGVGLYGALKPVGERLAVTGLVFRTAEAALFGVQSIVAFAFLGLYTAAPATGFSATQLAALAGIRGGVADAGYQAAALFFSFGSTAFFYLFLKSGYLPRWLSALGFVGSPLVVVACFGALVFQLNGTAYWALWGPIGLAEVVAGVWLLVKGLDLRGHGAGEQPATAAVVAPAARV